MSTLTARQQALLESSPGIRLVRLNLGPTSSQGLLVEVSGTRQATLHLVNEEGRIKRHKLIGINRTQIEATLRRDKNKPQADLRRQSIIMPGQAEKILQRNTGKRPAFPIGLSSPS